MSLTDWELLRLSPVPVLLVKSPFAYRNPTVLAAIDPTHALGKPARLDSRILGLGALIAKGLRGQLHAVHAYTTLPTVEREAAAIAEAAFVRALRSTKIRRARRHLVGGDPCRVIVDVSREVGSDIVVLGAVSRSGIRGAFIGNTAERLIDDLRSDLLVVKPAGFAVRIPRGRRGVRMAHVSAPMP